MTIGSPLGFRGTLDSASDCGVSNNTFEMPQKSQISLEIGFFVNVTVGILQRFTNTFSRKQFSSKLTALPTAIFL
jgi:hypothetical protein